MSDRIDEQRRRLLAFGALAAGSWPYAAATLTRGAEAAAATATPLAELDYGAVQFGDGPLARQARANHRLVFGLDEDALLRPFRVREGLPAPGRDLGGWYDADAFAPGATFGQWLSALARFHAITGDVPTRAKVGRLVRVFAATIDPQGRFYRHNRFPAYIYDKLVGGLVDAKRLAGDEAALATLARATDAALPYLPPKAIPRNEHALPGEDFTKHAWDESYTLPENQFAAWRATGDSRHLALARRFLYDSFFGALARGENVLPGKHAYSHVNALGSAAAAYQALRAPMYLAAARHGFDLVAAQSFATGGWGPDEHFVIPGRGALGASLATTAKSFETPCGAYAHIKLTRHLLRITRDARYGDSMERVLYNTVLGALPIEPDGHAFYYSDYTARAHKAFYASRWPCCSGTLPMVAADYAISACFADTGGIYVNLYVPAQVRWTQGGAPCRLSIATRYPYEAGVRIRLHPPRPQTFALHLRIPAWAAGAAVRVNGDPARGALQTGRFAAIRRQWRAGDTIDLELPLRRRLESVDAAHPRLAALLAGPLVLMRLLDADGAAEPVARAHLLGAERDQARGEWRAQSGATVIRLKAFADIDAERYSVYQHILPV